MYIVHFIYGWSWAGAGCGRNNLDQEESRARNLHICSDTWYRYDLLKRYGPCLMQSAVIFIVAIKISFIDIELIRFDFWTSPGYNQREQRNFMGWKDPFLRKEWY